MLIILPLYFLLASLFLPNTYCFRANYRAKACAATGLTTQSTPILFRKSAYLSSLRRSEDMRLLDSFRKKPFDAFVGKSIKYVIASIVTIVLLTSKSTVPLYYAVVSIINSAFGKLLKKIIKEPRPAQARKSSYGMPSTHTLAATYFCVVLYGKLEAFVSEPNLRAVIIVLSALYTIAACWWRVTSQLHTPLQVLVGGVIGSSAGALALRYEEPVFAALAAYSSRHSSPAALLLVRLLVAAFALPVVFKKELVWMWNGGAGHKSKHHKDSHHGRSDGHDSKGD